MSRPKYKLVVSDFHLGKGRYFSDGTHNILEDFIYDREFAEFLNYYRNGSFADSDIELIMNGDILNLLQVDHYGVHTHLMTERGMVHRLQKIIAGHPEFFQALRQFAATPHHTVTYIIGNHDAGMLWPAAQRVFTEAVAASVRFHSVAYEFDGVLVEHGQQYTWFEKINMERPFITKGLPEPVLNLPWGSLFAAVLLPRLKQTRPHLDKVKPMNNALRWILIHDFFWAIRAGLMIARFVFDTIVFRTRYQIRSGFKASAGLLKEISLYPDYDHVAFKILDDREHIHTVIFGHTHILKHRQWREGKEYINEGTWNQVTNLELGEFGTTTVLSYAFIEYPQPDETTGVVDPARDRPKVRLKQWRGHWKPEDDLLV